MTEKHAPQPADHHATDQHDHADQNALTPAAAPLSQQGVLSVRLLHRLVGNQAVQRLVHEGRLEAVSPAHVRLNASHTPIQRGGPDDETAVREDSPELRRILQVSQFAGGGSRFDLDYLPNSGRSRDQRPVYGKVIITLKLHVAFRDFTREIRRQEPYNTMRFTAAQRRDFAWKEEEKEEFNRNIITSIQDAWSGKHELSCTTPGCEELQAGLQVEVQLVGDAAEAHTRVTAQKVPEGAPRFRSFVQGDEAVLDRLDPTEASTLDTDELHHSIGPFEHDSADITPLQGQIDAFIRDFEAMEPQGDEFSDQFRLRVVGRSTTPGSKAYNLRLAQQRASHVSEYIFANTSRSAYREKDESQGETGTTDAEEFRRVDLFVARENSASQMTAAHEAGHMFGLGDEYEDAKDDDDPSGRGRFTGDQPSHYDDVRDELGTAAADDVMVGNNDSIMSHGMEVAPAHYTPFIQQLENLTNVQWTIKS